jgi:phospholipid/cholesterol/gamma-HCH transport system substrate-binding protein
MALTVTSERADGLSDGSPVLYRGVIVGQVTGVTRDPDQKHVYIKIMVDAAPPLPANLDGAIRTAGLVGGGAQLILECPPGQEPAGQLAAGQPINAHFVGLDILPPEFAQLATELRETSRQFRESRIVEHLDQQVQRAGDVMTSVQKLIDDPKMRADLTASIDNLRATSDSAKRIGANFEKFSGDLNNMTGDARATIGDVRAAVAKTQGHVDDLSKQLNDRLVQVSALLDQFQAIAAKVNKEQGTAGMLVNDPKLYENLVDTTQELKLTVADLHRLAQQWEQEGLSLKMK